MTYSLIKSRNNGWKIKNVIVSGVNLGLTYRNQFKQSMLDNENNIDLVINAWGDNLNVANIEDTPEL